MDSKTAKIISAQSSHIEELRKISESSQTLEKNSDCYNESKCLLDFEWLVLKYRWLRYENASTESYVRQELPHIELFTPTDFEHLTQCLLWIIENRYYEMTPPTGDGGVDLVAVEQLDMNFDAYRTTVVQCKLYRGYVPISEVRDFFGVMTANIAEGLFITTGKFTSKTKNFLEMAETSPSSNSLHCIGLQQWEKALILAEKIIELLKEVNHEAADDRIEDIFAEISKHQKNAKTIFYGSSFSPPTQLQMSIA